MEFDLSALFSLFLVKLSKGYCLLWFGFVAMIGGMNICIEKTPWNSNISDQDSYSADMFVGLIECPVMKRKQTRVALLEC